MTTPIGIIQPGKIGDVIILLPVAKHYRDQGYHVVWPVLPYIKDMVQPYVDYVEFLPCDLTYNSAYALVQDYKCLIPYCGFGDRPDLSHQWLTSGLCFDEYKYKACNVPFNVKYNLHINRNMSKELSLFNQLNLHDNEPYIVVCENSSDGHRPIADTLPKDIPIVHVSALTSSVFDWITILSKAKELHLIDSAIVNLCAGLGIGKDITCKRYYRPGYGNDKRLYPVLPSNWITIA